MHTRKVDKHDKFFVIKVPTEIGTVEIGWIDKEFIEEKFIKVTGKRFPLLLVGCKVKIKYKELTKKKYFRWKRKNKSKY